MKVVMTVILLIWLIISSLQFIFINHTCAKTSTEVIYYFFILIFQPSLICINFFVSKWKRTGEIICELEIESEDGKLKREIEKFSMQMLQNPLKFTPCGLFDLGYYFVRDVSLDFTLDLYQIQ